MPRPPVCPSPAQGTRAAACQPRHRLAERSNRFRAGELSRAPGWLRVLGLNWAVLLALVLASVVWSPARAQGVELATLQLNRSDEGLALEFAVRVTLPKAVEDALQRGVPVYFVAEAELLRRRWYWRDQRVARVQRQWRIAYQPLTSTWRVGLGGLNQSLPSLAEALAAVSRSSGWKLAEPQQIDPDSDYSVEFSYRLDTTQLPGPMQFGLGGPGDWALGAERRLRLE